MTELKLEEVKNMNEELTESVMNFIIERIVKNIKDNSKELEKDKSEYSRGQKLAYYETLDIIKNELIAHDIDFKQFGLDLNLEDML